MVVYSVYEIAGSFSSMATASAILLKCAVCSFETEVIPEFEKHFCSTNNNVVQVKELVSKKYHTLISEEFLNTYVFENETEANNFREKDQGNDDKAVMVFNKTKPIYPKVNENLSVFGKEFVRNTKPWVVNLLTDWCRFDEVICCKSSRYSEANESTETTDESKTDVPSTSNNSLWSDIPSTSNNSSSTSNNSSSTSNSTSNNSSRTSNNSSSTSNISSWSKVATSHLIELHTMHSAKFTKPSMKKKEVWKIICSEMHNRGFSFTVNQCEQKWKNLTKAYRDCVDHNSKSGNERKECPFYKELEDCYGYKPNVKPVFTLGTRKEDETDNEESKAESTSSDCDVTPKRKKSKQASEIVEILDDMRKEHKEMMKTLKEQHQKKMENEEKKLEIMAQLVEAMKK